VADAPWREGVKSSCVVDILGVLQKHELQLGFPYCEDYPKCALEIEERLADFRSAILGGTE